ncbi:MAG: hypothetical protein M1818_000430 [Claussenomyces sp. TS43310]|nr:MAG: hypothetical protein M1818_000430 [Claussenomyces sp. TS43310]
MEKRAFSSLSSRLKASRCLYRYNRVFSHIRRASTNSERQANPLGGYYESLLSQPLPQITSATRQPTTPSPPEELPKTDKEETLAKARVVFGSRLAGPAERRSEIESKSTMIAGVRVPPRPEEPDNCCMSGCVNCVWDRFRDEFEAWAAARKAADSRLRMQRFPGTDKLQGAVGMDDDGGGSETNWSIGLDADLASEDLFKDIPVGIREFMKQEKRLREMHLRNNTSGG